MDAFQVDLRGVVDLLSRHLYSSPRVFVRELLQNAVDAITARHAMDATAPARVRIEPSADGGLTVTDTGIGLTADEMRDLLSTIGRSSKRDDFDFARGEFLGQFGIGLLACFLVADEIVVRSRSARTPDSPTVEWRGRSDGSYELASCDHPLDEPGTEVRLRPAADAELWFRPATLRDLVTTYGSLLPVDITLSGELLTGGAPIWTRPHDEARHWCEQEFGFSPFAVIDLEVPLAGVRGLAFVLPMPANPAARPTHRVYLKRMLLSESVAGLLPDWTFFVRCVVDTTGLRPTASREGLFDDSLLEDTRTALGRQLRDWLIRLATVNPGVLQRFLSVHHLGVKAMALHDDGLLDLVRDQLRFETTLGTVTLAEFTRTFPDVHYSPTVDQFRSLSGVAASQGYGLVNAGYAYDEALLHRLHERGDFRAVPADSDDLAARLGTLATDDELAARPFLRLAAKALEQRRCEVLLRRFDPPSLPALYLPRNDADGRDVAESGYDAADDLWGGVLDSLGSGAPSTGANAQLVFNDSHPLVRRLIGCDNPDVVREVVGGLYGHALLQGRHPMRPADTALLNGALLSLTERAVRGN